MIRLVRIHILPMIMLVATFASQAAQLPDFKTLVKETAPAVVNISTIKHARINNTPAPFDNFRGPNGEEVPEIFRHFFQMPDQGQQSQPQRRSPQSLGSGFIISDDGYILTNHHVIEAADQVMVRLSDRRELEAEVIGSDKSSDIALLKIEATNLPTVKVGKSSQLEVGEWVLAIGSPFGFDHSVTAGIVSATQRALANETYVPFIQTDVAINPGNSGGPLFNLDGQVIGVNSQIYTRSGGFMGLSFAIPIDVAIEVADQLKEKGFVTRGWLGVVIQEVNKDLAESFGLDKPAGALVAKVLPNSPAEEIGLQAGDVILRFNNSPVIVSADLPHLVGRVTPETVARLTVSRNGETVVLRGKIGELPTKNNRQTQRGSTEEPKGNPLKLVVSELDDNRKEKWNIASGVVVRRVQSGAGAEAGLVVGDVITMLNGRRVTDVKSFDEIAEALPLGRSVPMRIIRRGEPLFIALRISP